MLTRWYWNTCDEGTLSFAGSIILLQDQWPFTLPGTAVDSVLWEWCFKGSCKVRFLASDLVSATTYSHQNQSSWTIVAAAMQKNPKLLSCKSSPAHVMIISFLISLWLPALSLSGLGYYGYSDPSSDTPYSQGGRRPQVVVQVSGPGPKEHLASPVCPWSLEHPCRVAPVVAQYIFIE